MLPRLSRFSGIFAYLVVSAVGSEAIIDGSRANVNQFPYQVSLIIHNRDRCGGGIIGDQHILTAAHCIVQSDGHFYNRRIFVFAGTIDLRKTSRPTVIIEVQKVYVPAVYTPPTLDGPGDIAVLRLNRSLALADNRHLQRLHLSRIKDENYYAGKLAMIAGFGWNWVRIEGDEEYGGDFDTMLRYAETKVLSQNECIRQHNDMKITEKDMCAQIKQHELSRPRGVCQGDSGSPLVYNDKTVVAVLVSSPPGCSEKMSSAVYTRVSHYLSFIQNAVNDKETKFLRTFELIGPTDRL